jgi:hypothetical protein
MLAGVVLLASTSDSSAGLVIVRNFGGGAAPGNTAGGGNLVDVFNAAADWWEMAYPNPNGNGTDFAVTINFAWLNIGGGTLAFHSLQAQGGVPNRETAANIRFDSDGSSVWFLDPTPHLNEEYQTFTESAQDFGAGLINTGRIFTDPIGAAIGRHDLLAVAKHEIGHALGLSAANTSYQAETGLDNDIDVLFAGLPFIGSVIPTTNPGVNVFNAHLNIGTALLFPSIGTGIRRIQSGVDILANAQLSRFQNPVLDPGHDGVIPEPTSLALLFSGGLCLVGYGRRRKRKQAA